MTFLCKMDFQNENEINLKRFAMVAYVASFWKRLYIEDKICEYIIENPVILNTDLDFLRSLMHILKEEIKKAGLPFVISNELTYVIIQLILATYRWYKDLNYKGCLLIPLKPLNRIPLHWTNYGSIDMAKTEKEWIVGLETVKIIDNNVYVRKCFKFCVYFMACTSIHKNYINVHSQEMFNFCLENQGHFLNAFWEKEWIENHIEFERKLNFIIHSVLYLTDLKVNTGGKYFPNSNSSKEVYMFQLSLKEMHKVAVQYYWNLLDSQEKDMNLVDAALFCAEENVCHFYRMDIYGQQQWYYHNKYLDTLIYFLRQMSMDQLEEFLDRTSNDQKLYILQGMIEFSFTGDFFFPTFHVMKNHMCLHDIEMLRFSLQFLLNKSILALRYDHRLGFDNEKSTSRMIFFTIWQELKKKLN